MDLNSLKPPVVTDKSNQIASRMFKNQGSASISNPYNSNSSDKLDFKDIEEIVDISDEEDIEETYVLDVLERKEHFENLCDVLDEQTLVDLAYQVIDAVEEDSASRQEWMDTIEKGLSLIGLKIEQVNEPFENACGAHHPLILEAAVKFQSKASAELLPADGPCKTKIYGAITPERTLASNKIRNFINYFICEEMDEFYPDTERLLFSLALMGSGFKKPYFDTFLNRPVSEFVPPHQVIVPNGSSDLRRASRYTHKFPRHSLDLRRDLAQGLYWMPDEKDGIRYGCLVPKTRMYGMGAFSASELGNVYEKEQELQGFSGSFPKPDFSTLSNEGNDTETNSEVYTIYEHYCSLYIEDLEEDKYYKENKLGSPYVVTVIKELNQVIGVRRNYDPKDESRKPLDGLVHYTFVPGFGFYGFGFIHLLGNVQLSLTSTLRSLIDAGTFSNLQGGFRLKGVRIMDDGSPMSPGQFKYVDSPIMDINKSLMPLTFKEPSQVLFAMMEFLDIKGQKFADSTEQIIQESNNMGPVGTTLALLDASAKFFNAIHKRLHLSQKQELKIICNLLKENLLELDYEAPEDGSRITLEDFSKIGIIPHSDPNISSSAHRMTKAQTILQMAVQTPEQHDMKKVLAHVYSNMDFMDPEGFLKKEEEATPLDPLTDISHVIDGKPIKAFEGQDHASHIAVKESFLQDPASGGSLLMQKVRPFIEANIQEHYFLKFKEQVLAASRSQNDPNNLNGINTPNQENNQNQENDLNTQAQAAKMVADMNNRIMQQQSQQMSLQDKATMLVAQADASRADTAAKKLESDESLKTLNLALENERIQLEKLKILADIQLKDKKLAQDLGIKLVQEGLKDLQERAKQFALADRYKQNIDFQKE